MHQASLGRRKRFDSRSSFNVGSALQPVTSPGPQDSLSRFSLGSGPSAPPTPRTSKPEKADGEGITLKVGVEMETILQI